MTQQSLHGVIIIDKPPDVTSQTVVSQVKRILGVRKAGHTGTLDPFATGVLPVCLNEGTKLSPFLMEQDKEYEGVILLGVETDTQDVTGNIMQQQEPGAVSARAVEEAFKSFEGTIAQIPPMFSAIKQNGVPLYKLARKGIEVERKARSVTIRSLVLLTVELPRVLFRVACSKGTYVRTLAGDIGTKLGCGGCLESLRRTRSGQFSLQEAVTLDVLPEMSEDGTLENRLLSPAQALASLPAVVVEDRTADKVRHGVPVTVGEVGKEYHDILQAQEQIAVLNPDGQLVAVAKTVPEQSGNENDPYKVPAWKLLRVFNLT